MGAITRANNSSGAKLESELGPEQSMFAEGCQRDWDELPRPDLPPTGGLDGGYVHSRHQRSRRESWFEVIAGKSMPTDGSAKCFGFVQTHDTTPKRSLFEVLKSQGMQMNQQVTFLTDGGEDVQDLPLYLNPFGPMVLDPKLRRAVSIWRRHLKRIRRVHRQPGCQQTDGQEAADALGTQECSPPAPGPRQGS